MTRMWRIREAIAGFLVLVGAGPLQDRPARSEKITIRGQEQSLHVYGPPGGRVAIVTSGDGGWVSLGPDVARQLAGSGYLVIGFDAKAYLASFTHGHETLLVTDVPRDYATLIDYAAKSGRDKPVLLGISEGAGLSVLAATDPDVQSKIAGVIAMGLPDKVELGWHFRDSIIYLTKKIPNEPLFSVRDIVGRVSPVPLGIFQSTHDEFVTPETTTAIVAAAREPRRLWTIEAANHGFADARPELWGHLEEALGWIAQPRVVR